MSLRPCEGSAAGIEHRPTAGRRKPLPQPNIKLPDREVDEHLLEYVSFGDECGLLRATPLSNVLINGAAIFGNGTADADAYALSRHVTSIDVYISHNWCVGRRQKLMVLAYYFQLWPAMATWLVIQLVLMLVTAVGILPVVQTSWTEHPRGVACKAVGVPVFLVGLFFSEDFARCCGRRRDRPMVFIDKTCICHSEQSIQMQGICKVGAFLGYSNRMLVIYTPAFLSRLWTVFEFASFVALHPVSHVEVIPTIMAQTIVNVCLMVSLWLPLVTVAEVYIDFPYALEVIFLVVMPLIANCFRSEARERKAMHERCAAFTVGSCAVGSEADRPLLYHNVERLMRALKVVPPAASQEEALAAFEALVRCKLPRLMETAVGRRGHRYVDFMLLSFIMWASYWFDAMVALAYGMSWSEGLIEMLVAFTVVFALDPLYFALTAELTRHCLGLRGALEVGFICIVAWIGAAISGLCLVIMTQLGKVSEFQLFGTTDWAFWVCLCVVALSSCTTALVFGASDRLARHLPKPLRLRRQHAADNWLWEQPIQRDSEQQAAPEQIVPPVTPRQGEEKAPIPQRAEDAPGRRQADDTPSRLQQLEFRSPRPRQLVGGALTSLQQAGALSTLHSREVAPPDRESPLPLLQHPETPPSAPEAEAEAQEPPLQLYLQGARGPSQEELSPQTFESDFANPAAWEDSSLASPRERLKERLRGRPQETLFGRAYKEESDRTPLRRADPPCV